LLTDKQRQVLSLVAIGYQYKQIAASMDIHESTVKEHISDAKNRLQTKTTSHAIAKSISIGVISPPSALTSDQIDHLESRLVNIGIDIIALSSMLEVDTTDQDQYYRKLSILINALEKK